MKKRLKRGLTVFAAVLLVGAGLGVFKFVSDTFVLMQQTASSKASIPVWYASDSAGAACPTLDTERMGLKTAIAPPWEDSDPPLATSTTCVAYIKEMRRESDLRGEQLLRERLLAEPIKKK